jgi:hypothetical protein
VDSLQGELHARHLVPVVDLGVIAAGPAVDPVPGVVGGEDAIAAGTSQHHVTTTPGPEDVVAIPAIESVIPLQAEEGVRSVAPEERVVPAFAVHIVLARAAPEYVRTAAANEVVVAGTSVNDIGRIPREDEVIAAAGLA